MRTQQPQGPRLWQGQKGRKEGHRQKGPGQEEEVKSKKVVRVKRPGVIPRGYRRSSDGNLVKVPKKPDK